jgi:hypothetical protein
MFLGGCLHYAEKWRTVGANLLAYAERFIQSLQQECTDHFIVCGERHFDYLVKEYVDHYHTERSHQGLGNMPVMQNQVHPHGEPPSNIVCRRRLGGLLKHFERAASVPRCFSVAQSPLRDSRHRPPRAQKQPAVGVHDRRLRLGVRNLVCRQRVSPERRAVRFVDAEDAVQLMAVLAESA